MKFNLFVTPILACLLLAACNSRNTRQPQDSERRSILTSPPESDVVAEEWGLRPSWGVSLKCVQEEAQKALVAHHDLPKPVVELAGVNKR